jgi:hypothetical protein
MQTRYRIYQNGKFECVAHGMRELREAMLISGRYYERCTRPMPQSWDKVRLVAGSE